MIANFNTRLELISSGKDWIEIWIIGNLQAQTSTFSEEAHKFVALSDLQVLVARFVSYGSDRGGFSILQAFLSKTSMYSTQFPKPFFL